jgi:hypothetical protein
MAGRITDEAGSRRGSFHVKRAAGKMNFMVQIPEESQNAPQFPARPDIWLMLMTCVACLANIVIVATLWNSVPFDLMKVLFYASWSWFVFGFATLFQQIQTRENTWSAVFMTFGIAALAFYLNAQFLTLSAASV